jgi:D-alanyl-D-alanine carboxypeptidase
MAELLDMGFGRAPARVAVRAPAKPPYMGRIGGTRRWRPRSAVAVAVARSLRPMPRPVGMAPSPAERC